MFCLWCIYLDSATTIALRLSSNTSQKRSGFEILMCKTLFNSFINSINGRTSRTACDRAIYSASVVLSAISVWSLLDHIIGQPAYIITKPVLDIRLLALLMRILGELRFLPYTFQMFE